MTDWPVSFPFLNSPLKLTWQDGFCLISSYESLAVVDSLSESTSQGESGHDQISEFLEFISSGANTLFKNDMSIDSPSSSNSGFCVSWFGVEGLKGLNTLPIFSLGDDFWADI